MMWRPSGSAIGTWLTSFVTVMLLSTSLYAQSKTIAEFAVHAGRYDRVDVPVTATLRGVPLHLTSGRLQLYEITNGIDVPVVSQLEPGDPAHVSWILSGETHAGQVRNFELRAVASGPARAGADQAVRVEDDGESVWIRIRDKPVLAYRYAIQPAPEGVDPIYARGGFIHPLYSPGGEVLSRIQPPDHYHHYGIWNPWTKTQFEGREVDFWNLNKGQGTVRPRQVLERTAGPLRGGFRASLDHVVIGPDSTASVALKEEWDVRVWNLDPASRAWLIDFVSKLNPLDKPLTVEAYRYQGFSLRATGKWSDATATLLTSEGLDKSNGNATRARWIDVNGVSAASAGTSGILFMTHPGNYNYPEQLRLWPLGANGGEENVFINFNPAQDRDWELLPGRSYALQYRMLVYDGKLDPATADRFWRDFANPPDVDTYPTGALEGARVLVYTRNGEGYVHDNIAASVAAIQQLGERHGFAVDVSNDPELFTVNSLRQYDALIFSNTNNEAFTSDEQRLAFQTYIRGGGGFMGIHSASGSERSWPWYFQLLGGTFVRHPPQQDFTVEVMDRSHPSTSFLPDRWDIENDECYYLNKLNPDLKVLLAADLTTVTDEEREGFPGEIFGNSFPLAWYHEFDGGRQWYTALGHRPEQYQDPMFVRHILGGISWVVTGISR
ncbi:MAG: ThuA domain-containing protein [Gemmatimonadota bacterium]|nr:MAG: ThuA domain-containing protein [Gemmatimonadota bacterium]